MHWRSANAAITAVLVLFGLAVTGCTTRVEHAVERAVERPPSGPARFAKHDRARLAWLLGEGRSTASVLIAYPPGQGTALVERLRALGGRVRYQADTVGYLRIDLPTARVLEAAALSGIDAVNLNGTQVYGASFEPDAPPPSTPHRRTASPSGGAMEAGVEQAGIARAGEVAMAPPPDSAGWRVAPPDASTPPENPYLPMRDVGAPQFVAAHPTFDGRGVTIGSIECCPDFRHPVLQESALTRDGKPVRKLAALYTVVADDSEATNRVHADAWVTAVHHRFASEGVRYRAPRDGRFRFGYYAGPTGFRPRAHWRADTLDHTTPPRAVLLDPRSGEVWLDVLDDHDFTHAPPLRDYNATGAVGTFGRDNPATPWDERLSFAVGVDTARGLVDVYPGNQAHITGIAGILAGTHLYGSAATGAAPHARMVFVSEGGGWRGEESHQSSRIEAMILLAQRPDVDIITTQEWYDLRLKDGGSVWSLIADRLVATYHKVLFQSAGNEGPGLGSVGEAVNGEHVMKVGGSINRDTWYTTFALLADRRDYLFGYASRGPRADGSIGPDFVAPMVQLIAQPTATSRDPAIRINTGFFSSRAIYRNPPGYTLQFGTSYTAPTAAGAAALLLSAARQTGVPADAARLHWALAGGARYFPEYQAYEQGTGILDVAAAWDRLQRAPAPVEIVIDAPVRTVMSPYLHLPGHGRGLYEREGWVAGDSATRLVTFTRTSGPADALTYQLRWLGNDGTFTSPTTTVPLRLNSAVTVPVVVHPRTWGAHSALLQLIAQDGATPAQQMSAVVVAAQPLDPAHHYTLVDHGQAEWLGKTSYFVSVPPDAAALDLALAIEHGAVALTVNDPTGGEYPSAAPALTGRHYDRPKDVAIGRTEQRSGGVIRRTIEYPEPGVWEMVIEHEGSATPELRLKPQQAATFILTATVTRLTGGAVQSEGASTPSLEGVPSLKGIPLQVALHNDFAPVSARVAGGPLASVAREHLTFRRSGPAIVRDLVVDSGTTRLDVALAHSSEPAADIDVHVFDCTSRHCERHVSAVFQGAEKELRVQNPRPGRWRIVLDPYALSSGMASVEYRDELVHPKYGTATVRESRLQLPPGGTATLAVVLHLGAAPEPGRTRAVRLEAESPEDQTPSGPVSRGGTRYPRGVLGVVRLDLPNR